MKVTGRLMGLDELALGVKRRVAVALVVIALAFAIQGVVALLDRAWVVAIASGALTVPTAQAAARTWRSRPG